MIPIKRYKWVSFLVGLNKSAAAIRPLFVPWPHTFREAHRSTPICFAGSLAGTPDYSYTLLATTNLARPVTWQTIVTNSTDATGLWQFTDKDKNSRQKFYGVLGE